MAGEVNSIADAHNWSISQIARAFGMDRKTVARRLEDSRITPSGKKNGYPTYALRDVGPALFSEHVLFDPEDDPSNLPPSERKAWYQSENERVKLEKELRQLIPVDEVHLEMSQLAKSVTTTLDSLPDILERDCELPPDSVIRVQETVDTLREQMYMRILQDEEDEAE
ncbi:DUF1441 family protein [Marinobacter nauticus]|uniref:DUF1441 family protein n=1 Tax=Marinobacter nauticus TaxID=2743 RepID=UPI000F1F4142|nr:DUF1441 family protein [Marinobacter nauticus]RKR79177.1 uncharacterized protein DUF1441 [Marinobacter nauticus]